MKKIYTLVLFCSLTFSMFANELHPQQLAPLYEHMVTVNKEWKNQNELPVELLQQPTRFDSDNERIQTHLRLVSQILDLRNHNLTESALANRKKNLSSLVKYWQTGTFPINTKHKQRQPYFIDHVGTACAVGHLLQTSGEEDLAQQISDEQNYAYIRELAYPQLGKWAETNGFTEDELAWIQPGYPSGDCLDYALPPFGWADNNPTSEIRVMKRATNGMIIGGNFSFSTSTGMATSLVLYQSNSGYVPYPVQIVGTVYDITSFGSHFYIVGDFEVPGTNFKNVIRVSKIPSTWDGLQSGQMNGIPEHVQVYDCNVYISGNFTQVDGQPQSNLAAYSLLDMIWTNQPKACSGTQYPDVLSVNGPVNDIEVHANKLVVGGAFTQVGSDATNTTSEGLSFYNLGGWTTSISSNAVSFVDHLVVYENKLLIGSNQIHYYDYSSWRPGTDADNSNGSWCSLFNISGPFDDLYVIGNSPNVLISKKGLQTRTLNGSNAYYNDTKIYLSVGSGDIFTGAIYGSEIYFGGNFSNGTSIYSDQGCGLSYYCSINTLTSEGKLMTFDKVLPLELSEFSAKLDEETNRVDLDWQTLTEDGIDKFIIERTIEPGGTEFKSIGEVKAVGESTNSVFYEFEDDVTRFVSPYIYYRLKIVDLNGAIEYSDIEVVHQKSPDRPKFRLYPNPSNGNVILNINGSEENNVTLSVFDVQGKLHHQEVVDLEDYFISKQFDFNHLNQGLYMIQVKNSRESFVIKMEIL